MVITDEMLAWPKSISDEVKSLKGKLDSIMKMVPLAHLAEDARKEFPALIRTVSVSAGGALSICGVLVMCDLKSVDQITPLLTWFAQRGHRQTRTPDDYAEIGRRTWDLGDIKVMGFFRGGKCRFVKVGERTEDVLELRCA